MVCSIVIFPGLKKIPFNTFLFLQILLLFTIVSNVHAQSGIAINAGPDTTLPCGSSCFNYKIKIPSLKTTDDYRVTSIPYNPLPFVTTTPALTLPCPEQDDKFFDVSAFAFDFCFYGETFQSLVIGTNGVISFDLSNALNCNNWDIDPVDGAAPIPFTGNSSPCLFQCDFPSDVLYPRLSIMGVYSDLAIDEISTDKKIEFRLEGTAPYRRAVISFNKIPVYECVTTSNTHQVIIYETTNIIEVFVKDRPPCNKWNGGNAILGIQNRARDKGVAPPGRNLGAWGSANMNEGWRFIPNGNGSLLDHVDLLLNNTVVATGVKGTVADDSIEVDFNNVCLPAASNQYTVKAYYKTCAIGGAVLTAEDNITVSKAVVPVLTATTTDAACGSNGTINVTSPLGNQYKYSTDEVSFQYATLFNLLPGIYTVFAKDTVAGCIISKSFNVKSLSTITASAQVTDAVCGNTATGSITVNASGGIAPYRYLINNGSPVSANVFSLLTPGTYAITVMDNNNCSFTFNDDVKLKAAVTATATVTNNSCSTNSDGSIVITASSGRAPYQYSKDGGVNYHPSGIFNNLSEATYTLAVKDADNCVYDFAATVLTNPGTVPAFAGNDTFAVIGQPIRLHATGGVNYSWQPAEFFDNPSSANPLVTIQNDSSKFIVTVKDIAGCIGYDEILITAYTAQTYFVPKAFSPNGDGRNEIFKPVAIGIQSTDYFRVFNRYGQIIFETGQRLDGWDGTYKGKKQLPGTYVWDIKGKTFSGRVIEKKGTVVLVR